MNYDAFTYKVALLLKSKKESENNKSLGDTYRKEIECAIENHEFFHGHVGRGEICDYFKLLLVAEEYELANFFIQAFSNFISNNQIDVDEEARLRRVHMMNYVFYSAEESATYEYKEGLFYQLYKSQFAKENKLKGVVLPSDGESSMAPILMVAYLAVFKKEDLYWQMLTTMLKFYDVYIDKNLIKYDYAAGLSKFDYHVKISYHIEVIVKLMVMYADETPQVFMLLDELVRMCAKFSINIPRIEFSGQNLRKIFADLPATETGNFIQLKAMEGYLQERVVGGNKDKFVQKKYSIFSYDMSFELTLVCLLRQKFKFYAYFYHCQNLGSYPSYVKHSNEVMYFQVEHVIQHFSRPSISMQALDNFKNDQVQREKEIKRIKKNSQVRLELSAKLKKAKKYSEMYEQHASMQSDASWKSNFARFSQKFYYAFSVLFERNCMANRIGDSVGNEQMLSMQIELSSKLDELLEVLEKLNLIGKCRNIKLNKDKLFSVISDENTVQATDDIIQSHVDLNLLSNYLSIKHCITNLQSNKSQQLRPFLRQLITALGDAEYELGQLSFPYAFSDFVKNNVIVDIGIMRQQIEQEGVIDFERFILKMSIIIWYYTELSLTNFERMNIDGFLKRVNDYEVDSLKQCFYTIQRIEQQCHNQDSCDDFFEDLFSLENVLQQRDASVNKLLCMSSDGDVSFSEQCQDVKYWVEHYQHCCTLRNEIIKYFVSVFSQENENEFKELIQSDKDLKKILSSVFKNIETYSYRDKYGVIEECFFAEIDKDIRIWQYHKLKELQQIEMSSVAALATEDPDSFNRKYLPVMQLLHAKYAIYYRQLSQKVNHLSGKINVTTEQGIDARYISMNLYIKLVRRFYLYMMVKLRTVKDDMHCDVFSRLCGVVSNINFPVSLQKVMPGELARKIFDPLHTQTNNIIHEVQLKKEMVAENQKQLIELQKKQSNYDSRVKIMVATLRRFDHDNSEGIESKRGEVSDDSVPEFTLLNLLCRNICSDINALAAIHLNISADTMSSDDICNLKAQLDTYCAHVRAVEQAYNSYKLLASLVDRFIENLISIRTLLSLESDHDAQIFCYQLLEDQYEKVLFSNNRLEQTAMIAHLVDNISQYMDEKISWFKLVNIKLTVTDYSMSDDPFEQISSMMNQSFTDWYKASAIKDNSVDRLNDMHQQLKRYGAIKGFILGLLPGDRLAFEAVSDFYAQTSSVTLTDYLLKSLQNYLDAGTEVLQQAQIKTNLRSEIKKAVKQYINQVVGSFWCCGLFIHMSSKNIAIRQWAEALDGVNAMSLNRDMDCLPG
jgi:hypothetical protein